MSGPHCRRPDVERDQNTSRDMEFTDCPSRVRVLAGRYAVLNVRRGHVRVPPPREDGPPACCAGRYLLDATDRGVNVLTKTVGRVSTGSGVHPKTRRSVPVKSFPTTYTEQAIPLVEDIVGSSGRRYKAKMPDKVTCGMTGTRRAFTYPCYVPRAREGHRPFPQAQSPLLLFVFLASTVMSASRCRCWPRLVTWGRQYGTENNFQSPHNFPVQKSRAGHGVPGEVHWQPQLEHKPQVRYPYLTWL
ncbi:hypothetical protein Bbelb_074770 [Branchiostoma belcheri]|nr:hypothetical protein Bbelb_074770 [Branchiostoma belcheri]